MFLETMVHTEEAALLCALHVCRITLVSIGRALQSSTLVPLPDPESQAVSRRHSQMLPSWHVQPSLNGQTGTFQSRDVVFVYS